MSARAQKFLNMPLYTSELDPEPASREAETEEYYWYLAGEGRKSEEMSLVAIMVDEAQIYFDDKRLKMVFLRKL